jgi:hypothetical protein
MNRRGFILGLSGMFAAPAIVKPSSLMLIKPYRLIETLYLPSIIIPKDWCPLDIPADNASLEYYNVETGEISAMKLPFGVEFAKQFQDGFQFHYDGPNRVLTPFNDDVEWIFRLYNEDKKNGVFLKNCTSQNKTFLGMLNMLITRKSILSGIERTVDLPITTEQMAAYHDQGIKTFLD